MCIKRILAYLFILFMIVPKVMANTHALAITIDDLPFVGEGKNFHLNMILEAIKKEQIPVTGFVIAKEVEANNWDMLHKFHDAGLGLGNHTLSHANLKKIGSHAYIQEIAAADKILSPVLTEPKYFRYPYLVMGDGHEKQKVMQYLSSKKYQIAPITIDSKDFVFNQLLLTVPQNERRGFLEVLRPCYLDFIWKQTLKAEEKSRFNHKEDEAQILLIHANLLNAYVLPDIIKLYKQNGFEFVSLEDALKSTEPVKPALVQKQKRFAKAVENIESFFAWD